MASEGRVAPSRKFEWVVISDDRWLSSGIPDGEVCAARVQRTSKNRDGSHWHYAYRNGLLLGCAKTLDAAKRLCEAGVRVTNGKDNVREYVDNHSGEIPPFLLLTEEERRAVWAQYPMHAPSASRVRLAERRPGEDPATAALRAEKLSQAAASKGRARAPKPSPDALKGTLGRLKEGNPKKPGTGAHKRWASLLAAADEGQAAEAWVAEGGNPETLANAVRMGWVALTGK